MRICAVRSPRSFRGSRFVSFALHSRTWVCFSIILILPTLALLYRIYVEEIALRLAFRADYEGYSRTTKRLIPCIY